MGRHFFNLRHMGRTAWWIPASAAVAIAVLAILIRPQNESAAGAAACRLRRSRASSRRRCAACLPTIRRSGRRAPGIKLDTPEEIKSEAQAIEQQAVQTKAMPLGNVTGMTQAERDVLGRWIAQGAKIP